MPNLDSCIIDKCRLSWNEEFIKGMKNKDNCSGFVKAVSTKIGIPLPATANADGIDEALQKGWTKLTSGVEAAEKAASGFLVVAALKSSAHSPAQAHGHVAIVISGPLYKGKYPRCWSGSLGGAKSQGEKSIGEIWNRTDRDKVNYYAYQAQSCR